MTGNLIRFTEVSTGNPVLIDIKSVEKGVAEGASNTSLFIFSERARQVITVVGTPAAIATATNNYLFVATATGINMLNAHLVRKVEENDTLARVKYQNLTELDETFDLAETFVAIESAIGGIISGGGGGSANLAYSPSATQGEITNTAGTNAIIPLATPDSGTNLAGLLSPGDKTKLDFISITQAVDLDAMEAAIITSGAVVGNDVVLNQAGGGTITIVDAGKDARFRDVYADAAAANAETNLVDGDVGYVVNSDGITGGAAGIDALIRVTGGVWEVYKTLGTAVDTNITNGALAVATADRTIPMNGNSLDFDGATIIRLDASTDLELGDGAGANLPTVDSDDIALLLSVNTATGKVRRVNKDAHRSLTASTDPVNGTTVAWYVGQLYRNTANNTLWEATAKSTDPDSSGAGSVFSQVNLGGGGAGNTWYDTGVKTFKIKSSADSTSWITETAVGTYTIVVPAGEEVEDVSFVVTTAAGPSQNASGGAVNVVLDDSANVDGRNQTVADASPVTVVGIPAAGGATYPLGTLNTNAHVVQTSFAALVMTVNIGGFPGQFADGSKISVQNLNGE